MKRSLLPVMTLAVTVALSSCGGGGKPVKKEDLKPAPFTGAKGEVKLMTLDPGHFHAALVQKICMNRLVPMFSCTHQKETI